MRKWNWTLIILVLIGFVIGNFIGTYFTGTWLDFGRTFGLTSPFTLDMFFIILTFGLTFNINIASVLGVVIALVIYRFIR